MKGGFIGRAIRFLRDGLWSTDREHRSRLHAFGVETLRVLHLVATSLKEDGGGLLASGLTYSTLMAMVPFLVILFSIGKAIGFTKAEQMLLAASADLPEQIREFVRHLLDVVGEINPAALGAVGGVFFLVVVYGLLNRVEGAFNRIWGVERPRSIADKIRNYLSVLIISPALLLVANAGSAWVTAFAGRVEWIGPAVTLFMQVAPVFALTVAFVALYLFLPNTRIRLAPALIGGVTGAVLTLLVQYVVLKFGAAMFRKYAIYGSFASIPVFLYWLHLNWTILLFGAELAFAVQNRDRYADERAARGAGPVDRLRIAYALMSDAVERFRSPDDSAVFSLSEFACRRKVPLRLADETACVLTRAGLLAEVGEDAGEGGRLALAQAPENLSAERVYRAVAFNGSPEGRPALSFAFDYDETLFDPVEVRRFAGG